MTVKIQHTMKMMAGGPVLEQEGLPLLAYNKNRDFHVFIDSTKVRAGHR